MSLYEHVLIARQDLSNVQADGLADHFLDILSDNGGNLVAKENWGLRKMAYKIKRNRKGHYIFLKTDSPPDAVKEMERLMGIHEDVLRVLTIKVKAHSEKPSPMVQRRDDNSDRSR